MTRKMYLPLYRSPIIKNEVYTRKNNEEVHHIYQKSIIKAHIMNKLIEWAGHI